MDQRLFLHVNNDNENHHIINDLKIKIETDVSFQCYVINSPLGEKYAYDYSHSALVLLIPKRKIIFIDLYNNPLSFNEFTEDFIEDLSSISDKYKYKKHIGRPREWAATNIIKVATSDYSSIDELLKASQLDNPENQRISDLLISLLIGSINDIEKIGARVPVTLLEKVKRNIILFDGEQTRFMYQEFNNKTVVIQGLSGTGKTELLLHKLKDLYLNTENSKIYFTCHNIALANTLKERVPIFFNFMKVEKQIEWNKNLWVDRAWGSASDKNSGIYSYLCNFYNVSFIRWSQSTNYDKIFSLILEKINQIPEKDFKYAFDYVLVDERQDFPDVFFKVLEKVVKEKVFVAGDIFQDIFESSKEKVLNVDVILNKCYRTDPKTLMFAHSIGLGLFEDRKWNWFDDEEWKAFGYNIKRLDDRKIRFSRAPIRRFEDVENDDLLGTNIIYSTNINSVINLIEDIRKTDDEISPNDIAIIILDDSKTIYGYVDNLAVHLYKQLGWTINRAYESKGKIENTLYVSNPNNVKGLEFPFVICLTNTIKDSYRYRNILYTMLTRSFLNSYLMITDPKNTESLEQGLDVIKQCKYIETVEPTSKEKAEIKNQLIQFLMKPKKSYKEFLDEIFEKENVPLSIRDQLEDTLLKSKIEKFDELTTIEFINTNKKYY